MTSKISHKEFDKHLKAVLKKAIRPVKCEECGKEFYIVNKDGFAFRGRIKSCSEHKIVDSEEK